MKEKQTTKKGRLTTLICFLFITIFYLFSSCDNQLIKDILPEKKKQIPITLYTIEIETRDAAIGDSFTATPSSGIAGDTITLNYTVVNSAFYNELEISGINSVIIPGASGMGKGTRTYTIDTEDASDGVITIIATFTHTDQTPDPIMFSDTTGLITVKYGDVFSNMITNAHNGSGTISYSSSDPGIATVNGSGVVTILKTGTTVITAEKAADAVYSYASRSYTLTINPRLVTITPDLGLSKVFNTNDPTFTFTASEALIAGSSFSGELSRIPGENAGTYSFTLGTLSAGSNYTLTLDDSVTFEITKAEGSVVNGAPALFGISSPGSITVNAVSIPSNPGGQAVEYAVSTAADGTGLSEWQAGATFSGLAGGIDYYIYSRSTQNTNYDAGDYTISDPILFYTLAFDANGAVSGKVLDTIAVLPGTVVTIPVRGDLVRNNSSFICWNTDSGGAGDSYNPGQIFTVTENTVLYARWIG